MRAMLWILLTISDYSSAEEGTTLNARLQKALLCESEPQNVVLWLHPKVGEDSTEAKIVASGEDIEYRIDVLLRKPIELAGASTKTVTWQVEGEKNFDGIVFAEFVGNSSLVASHLALHYTKDKDANFGKYSREIPDGNLCPPTIMLSPISESRFMLGCGWCPD